MSGARCNLCGGTEFGDFNGRVAVGCANCGSLERTRLLWAYIEQLDLGRDARVLHLAPEKGIHARLSAMLAPGNYHLRDIDPGRYAFAAGIERLDLTELDDMPGDRYDLIVHSHVLEHVPCNIAYCLFHLHRMLREGGTHLFQVPFMGDRWDECFQDIGDLERRRRFGQEDHVRIFGKNDVPAHLGKLVELDVPDAERDLGRGTLEQGNIPEAFWRGYSPHAVVRLSKYQMKFLPGPKPVG
jgi:phosphoglycolate phosphatase